MRKSIPLLLLLLVPGMTFAMEENDPKQETSTSQATQIDLSQIEIEELEQIADQRWKQLEQVQSAEDQKTVPDITYQFKDGRTIVITDDLLFQIGNEFVRRGQRPTHRRLDSILAQLSEQKTGKEPAPSPQSKENGYETADDTVADSTGEADQVPAKTTSAPAAVVPVAERAGEDSDYADEQPPAGASARVIATTTTAPAADPAPTTEALAEVPAPVTTTVPTTGIPVDEPISAPVIATTTSAPVDPTPIAITEDPATASDDEDGSSTASDPESDERGGVIESESGDEGSGTDTGSASSHKAPSGSKKDSKQSLRQRPQLRRRPSGTFARPASPDVQIEPQPVPTIANTSIWRRLLGYLFPLLYYPNHPDVVASQQRPNSIADERQALDILTNRPLGHRDMMWRMRWIKTLTTGFGGTYLFNRLMPAAHKPTSVLARIAIPTAMFTGSYFLNRWRANRAMAYMEDSYTTQVADVEHAQGIQSRRWQNYVQTLHRVADVYKIALVNQILVKKTARQAAAQSSQVPLNE